MNSRGSVCSRVCQIKSTNPTWPEANSIIGSLPRQWREDAVSTMAPQATQGKPEGPGGGPGGAGLEGPPRELAYDPGTKSGPGSAIYRVL